jgi:hypothetical protein
MISSKLQKPLSKSLASKTESRSSEEEKGQGGNYALHGCTVAQVASHYLPTAAAQVQSEVIIWDLWWT